MRGLKGKKAEKRATDAEIYKYGATAPHEYIISGFDIYFGLWDRDPQGDGTSYGDEYPYPTRAEMKAGDDAIEGAAGTDALRGIETLIFRDRQVGIAG